MLHKNFAHHYRITIQTFLSIFFLFWPFNVLGQPEAISTDRILQTNTVDILQPGYFQIETGVYSYETDRESNLKSNHNFLNNTSLRIGYREDLELRVGLYGYNFQHTGSEDNSGLSDGELSTKILLLKRSKSIPKTTLNTGVSIPIGDEPFSSDSVDPFFSFISSPSHMLPFDSISNENSYGLAWNDGNANFKYGSLWGYNISRSVNFYGEFFGSIPIENKNESTSHGFDFGFTWLVKTNLQLDIFAGTSLNNQATDFFINTGFSMRFPQ